MVKGIVLLVALALPPAAAAAADLQIGAAKTDVTPTTPIRLSGYAARKTESDGVAQKLYARALAVRAARADAAVLVTVDTMALPRELVEKVAARLKEKAALPRERLAICATHTHAAPCLTGAAPNLFGHPLPADQQARIDAYTNDLADKLERSALAALDDLKPGTLTVARGSVGFAANRRKPPAPDAPGPVDQELPVLIARGADGAVRAVVANYACHCTTGGADINQVHGDWAGFASDNLEAANAGAVALITIGCGADANPKPRGTLDLARQHGAALAHEVARLLKPPAGKATSVTLSSPPEAKLKVIPLPYDKLPSKADLEKLAEQPNAIGYNAKVQLAQLARDGRLPDSLPYTVQTWRFGDDLAMVFLAGEVVVDYALRLKHDFEPSKLWITAYANDVPCYIPSRRILAEGGYEAEGAMVYYARPTRLAPSVENEIVRTVHSLLPLTLRTPKSLKEFPPPKSPEQSRQSIRIDGDLRVELVAAEPLIQSPVAIDWDLKGRLWVLEMYDYPSGLHDNNTPGGRVVVLESTRNDGRYDKRTVFLDRLPYPQGLMCWRTGVLVCAAPDILYAPDDDHDGKADAARVLFSGFNPDNQQWEVNGLAWGLDNWVHGASSIRNDPITTPGRDRPTDLGNRDFRMNPDTGAFEPAAGRTQFCRVRDDFGNWFGNDNSNPLFHYPLDERYVRRNPRAAYPPPRVHVVADKDPTRLFPISPLLERFNNPESANRVTSACGPSIYRDTLLFPPPANDARPQHPLNAFFCEPVHNVVRRLTLTPSGATFTARRHPTDDREFLASTDNWFRPVQTRTGPDGALWVVDMYRFVIEHPRWITPDRLKTLDTRAGHDLGRIYRILPAAPPRPTEDLSKLPTPQLAAKLDTPNGVVRDLVHRELIHRQDPSARELLDQLARHATPTVRVQALSALDGLSALKPDLLLAALRADDPRLRRHAAQLAGPLSATDPATLDSLLKLASDPDPAVRYQAALSLGDTTATDDGRVPAALADIFRQAPADPWIRAALLSASGQRPLALLKHLHHDPAAAPLRRALVASVDATSSPEQIPSAISLLLGPPGTSTNEDFELIGDLLDLIGRRQIAPSALPPADAARLDASRARARAIASGETAAPDAARAAAFAPFCRGPHDREDVPFVDAQLDARTPPRAQAAALAALGRSRAPDATDRLIAAIPRVSPALRGQAFDLLAAPPAAAASLLAAVERQTVSPADVPAATRARLLAHADPALRDRAAKALATSRPPARAAALKSFEPALSLPGDPARGRPLFEKACAACHRVGDLGHAVGPDLAAVTDKSPAYLLPAIVDPNAAVEGRFVAYQLETTDGDTHVGILADENAATLTLAQPSGLRQSIPRRDIKSLSATKLSLMPEGLEQGLSPQDMADLIAFTRAAAPAR